MTVFIVVPALFLLFIWDDREKLKDFRFWLSGLVLALVMFSLVPFLVGLLAWLAICLIGMIVSKYDRRWVVAFSIVLAGFIGYSVQMYVPIRSTQNPAIDENDPEDITRFKYFLERKQYGQTSMVTRALTRRASWASQFGTHERMGFWGFFREQYSSARVWFIPILLGLYGIIYQIRRRRKEGVILLLLFLIASVGLLFYINFSDGTRETSWKCVTVIISIYRPSFFRHLHRFGDLGSDAPAENKIRSFEGKTLAIQRSALHLRFSFVFIACSGSNSSSRWKFS